MSPPRKKPRVSPEDLQTAILSVFALSTPQSAASRLSDEARILAPSTRTAPYRLTALCEQLTCVATTREPLTSLQEELRDRVYSPSELSDALFANADDGPGAIPPLCLLSSLLSERTLRPPDLPHLLVAQRAAFEMKSDNACGCRGVHAGVRAFLRCLQEAASPAAETFLSHFVAVLFRDGGPIDRDVGAAVRLRLAELTVRYLRQHGKNSERMREQFVSWLNQAVLPTRFHNGQKDHGLAVRLLVFLRGKPSMCDDSSALGA